MSPEKKDNQWHRHIEAWKQSKLSQKAYCQQHQLSLATFGYWRTKLNRDRAQDTRKKLVPVKLTQSERVTLTLPGNICIETTGESLASVLTTVYQVLQART